jgi:hypothetical protein
MKTFRLLMAATLAMAVALPAVAADFEFHGDMNNRFLIYTNRADWLQNEQAGEIEKGSTVDATYGELKYRFWTEIADDSDDVKGVYAIEVGGIRFGEEGTGRGQGGSYSGDGANVETRWAYLDFQTPAVEKKMRWRMGLSPWKINAFLWQETATGVNLYGALSDLIDYDAAWIRTVDKLPTDSDNDQLADVDNFYGRLNFKPTDSLEIGAFGLYVYGDGDGVAVTGREYELKQFASDADLNYWNLGIDGSYSINNLFFNWDFIYQVGDVGDIDFDDSEFSGDTRSGDFDLRAWFVHADVGYRMGKHTFTYTFWYASGDDDAGDRDLEGFLAIDLDRDDNLTIFEGTYVDDDTYFTERPYILDKGFVMNKIAWDFRMTEKLTLGAAGMYMMTAEDIKYTEAGGGTSRQDEIGFEINGYAKYMLFRNVELAVNAGYLFAGDALDAFETGGGQPDGNSDENIFASSARIRYKF